MFKTHVQTHTPRAAWHPVNINEVWDKQTNSAAIIIILNENQVPEHIYNSRLNSNSKHFHCSKYTVIYSTIKKLKPRKVY